MRNTLFLLLALVLPLAACSGEDDPVAPNVSGSLSFAYSGDLSGTFAVSGEANFGSDSYPENSFAAAATEPGSVNIVGFRPTQRPKFDYVGIDLTGVTGPGTITLCANPTSGSGCPSLYWVHGFTRSTSTFDQAYSFVSGQVTIAEITAESVRGSFQGTAVFYSAPGQPDLTRTITVTNGQFDVPVRNDL